MNFVIHHTMGLGLGTRHNKEYRRILGDSTQDSVVTMFFFFGCFVFLIAFEA